MSRKSAQNSRAKGTSVAVMAKFVKVILSYMRSALMSRLRSIWITPSFSDWLPSGGRGRLVRLEVKITLS